MNVPRAWKWWLGLGLLLLVGGGIWVGPRMKARFFPRDRVWERIQRTGVWQVGTDPSFPPFEMLEDGRMVGFDVDLAEAIAARWGVQVHWHSVGFDGLIDAVRTGRIEGAISAIPYDPLLTRDVRFSRPYFDAGWRVIVPRASSTHALEDLRGKRLAVEWGSEGDVWGRRLRRKYEGIKLVLKPSLAEVLTALREGEADAAIVDGITAREHRNEFRELLPPLSHNGYVIVLPYRAPELQRAVDQALKDLERSGGLRALEEKWLAPRK